MSPLSWTLQPHLGLSSLLGTFKEATCQRALWHRPVIQLCSDNLGRPLTQSKQGWGCSLGRMPMFHSQRGQHYLSCPCCGLYL